MSPGSPHQTVLESWPVTLQTSNASLNCLALGQRKGVRKHTCGQVNLGLGPHTPHTYTTNNKQPKKEKKKKEKMSREWAIKGLYSPVHEVCVSITQRGSSEEGQKQS